MGQKNYFTQHPTPAISQILWSLTKGISYWYESITAHRHKFQEGDILILKSRDTFGFGIRPVAVVNSHYIEEDEFGKHGVYEVAVHQEDLDLWYEGISVVDGLPNFQSDSDSPIFRKWSEKNEIPQGLERVVENNHYSNLTVEYRFRKANCKTVDEALALYGSKKV